MPACASWMPKRVDTARSSQTQGCTSPFTGAASSTVSSVRFGLKLPRAVAGVPSARLLVLRPSSACRTVQLFQTVSPL